MASGGRQLFYYPNNQPMLEQHSPVVWSGGWSDEKNREREVASALGGRRLMGGHNNQLLIVDVGGWGEVEEGT